MCFKRKKKTIIEVLIENHKWCILHGCANDDPEYNRWLMREEKKLHG
jgi:hypothetical protein